MKAIPYNINAPLKMRMPQEGSAPQGGVAAAHKVSCAPQRLRGGRTAICFWPEESLCGSRDEFAIVKARRAKVVLSTLL